MEIRLPSERPTDQETAVLDGVLGPPDSPWRGGDRTSTSTRFAAGLGAARPQRRSLLLPALGALQDSVGWISRGAVRSIAERLDVPPADIWGVATFYHLLETEAGPGEVVHVCTDIACPDGERRLSALTAEGAAARPSPCLGQCDRGPGELRCMAGVGRAVPWGPTIVDGDLRLLAGVGKGSDLDAYVARGGYAALREAVVGARSAIIDEVEAAGLLGRGGAAFPAAVKWRSAASTEATERYVICNADESEPGTFKDRFLLVADPHAVIEGVALASYAIGASKAYIYIRGEYPHAHASLQTAIDHARRVGLVGGPDSVVDLEIEVRRGEGAYICGEETALLNSIEGYRGEPRAKPPFPTQVGLFGKPTVINNVETLANVPIIVREGATAYRSAGTDSSPGTKLFSVSGDVRRPGVYELAFGASLRHLLDLAEAGSPKTVLMGGAAGVFIGPDLLDMPLSYEAARDLGATLGSGAVVVFGPNADIGRVVQRIADFFRDESCGQCVPCRIGTARQSEAVARHLTGGEQAALLGDIDRAMTDASICGLGQTAASAIRSAFRLGLLGGADV